MIGAPRGASLTFIQRLLDSLPKLAEAAEMNRTSEPAKAGGGVWQSGGEQVGSVKPGSRPGSQEDSETCAEETGTFTTHTHSFVC